MFMTLSSYVQFSILKVEYKNQLDLMSRFKITVFSVWTFALVMEDCFVRGHFYKHVSADYLLDDQI